MKHLVDRFMLTAIALIILFMVMLVLSTKVPQIEAVGRLQTQVKELTEQNMILRKLCGDNKPWHSPGQAKSKKYLINF